MIRGGVARVTSAARTSAASPPGPRLETREHRLESELVRAEEYWRAIQEANVPRVLDEDVAEIARGHHETLNGTGDPDGVTGESVSLETRIMTGCDIFDALTASHRPYKKAMPVDKAIQILRSEAKDGTLDADWREF